MMNIKRTITLLLLTLSLSSLFSANTLHMFIDYNRFLDKDKNTILLLDYQLPYSNLVFFARNNGYFAELKVKVEVCRGDSILIAQEIIDNIGISNKSDASNNRKSYLNRLSFVLTETQYDIRFTAEDLNSQKTFNWTFPVESLAKSALMSDIELDTEVRPDTLGFMPKFQRNKVLYRPEPSILVNKNLLDYVSLYLEVYPQSGSNSGKNLLNLSLEKDSLIVMDEYIDYEPKKNMESLSLKIPLQDLKPGQYSGSVLLQAGELTEERNFEFVLYEEKEELINLFANVNEEYELMRYFLGSNLPANWSDLSIDKKRRYITQFWRDMARTTNRSTKEIMSLVQERVDYSNRVFGHLKAGWTSDMGRIYIRNGAPDEIDRDTSSDQSRFVRKDYQIWKYSSGNKPVYMFIDIQMNGNFRLIYADDDDLETSNPDWLRYVGTDFDESKLDN